MDEEQDTQQGEVEGHAFKFRGAPAEAAAVDAHAFRAGKRNDEGPPPEAVEREQPVPDADDDVEAHRRRFHG